MTTKIELPTWSNEATTFKEWERKLVEYLTAIGDDELLDKKNKPDMLEFLALPECSTEASWLKNCAKHSQNVLLAGLLWS